MNNGDNESDWIMNYISSINFELFWKTDEKNNCFKCINRSFLGWYAGTAHPDIYEPRCTV